MSAAVSRTTSPAGVGPGQRHHAERAGIRDRRRQSRAPPTIGAWTIGCSIPSSSQTGVRTIATSRSGPTEAVLDAHVGLQFSTSSGYDSYDVGIDCELLVPAVEVRVVARIPRLAQPRRCSGPSRGGSRSTRAQVAPEVVERRASPEPVAVVDAVDHQSRLEHERVRDHRVVLGVGVLLDVEVLLDRPVRGRRGTVHWAPTEARNSCVVWWSSVAIVTIWV